MRDAAARRLHILERLYGRGRTDGHPLQPSHDEAIGDERDSRVRSDRAGAAFDVGTARLCQACAEVVGVSGAGIMLMSGDGPWGSLCTTNDVSALIEEWQYTLGEGPCVDAFHHDRPVLEPDLAQPESPRWPAFAALAVPAGVAAVFGFPLRVGAVRLGALNLYSDDTGPLDDDQHADALILADVVARAVLVMEADAPPGEMALEIEAGGDFKYVVHQASGMVSVQLDITVGEALARLRARAFAHDQPLVELAESIVAGEFRFAARREGGEFP